MHNHETSLLPRYVKVKWLQLNVTITVQLNVDVNPRLINLLLSHLPYRSLQNHALVSGDHLYHLVPSERLIYTVADYIVPDRTTEPDGTVFLSGLQHLAIKYGPLTENLPAAPCGSVVPQDMEKLRNVGNCVWKAHTENKQIIEVIAWDAREPEPKQLVPLALERTGSTAETDKSWTGVAFDIQQIHRGQSPSYAGSKNSYFATMIFTNGEVRSLGYNVLNNILKIAATQPQFDLQHLMTLYHVFASIPSEFLGYVGATFLQDTYHKISELMKTHILSNANHEEARQDFLAIVSAFALYVNLLNAQNLHIFPWRHTVEYPI
ncbi:hypothetical protein CDD82_59 [Ophiocordyceps australis]|uniref:Cucumopine synthase C-terminal helical bundle domain-containing protein n=1 Tax=Ophiocordyceps australis TaxID=1399860 RepID=A0A2C5YZH7_9HYPO|nr:hypothetical protein CDD82_59 [Ophiocordyceps australis]